MRIITMKKCIFIQLMLFVCAALGNAQSSYGDVQRAKEFLEMEAASTNELLSGESVGYGIKLLSCDFDGKNFIYSYEIDEDYISIEQMRETREERQVAIKRMLMDTDEFAPIIRNLKKINGNVIYYYVGNMSHKSMSIIIKF